MTREIFIVRHGETDFNLQGIVQGRGVDPSLNDTGRKQAAQFFDRYKNEAFDVIYTSSLRRTHESVKGFISKGIEWKQFSELDEISWGIFEGKRAANEFKILYRELLESWSNGNLDAKAPQGESPKEVQLRQLVFLNFFQQQTHKKTLVCMHGRAMRIFLPTLLQKSLLTMDEFPHHNLTLYKLNYEDEKFKVKLFNNMDHLHRAD
ncbi:MAG: histidine phosphatase family protein [Chitinophagales bacterium]